MVAQFATPSEHDDDLVCTSALLKPDFKPNKEMVKAYYILYGINYKE